VRWSADDQQYLERLVPVAGSHTAEKRGAQLYVDFDAALLVSPGRSAELKRSKRPSLNFPVLTNNRTTSWKCSSSAVFLEELAMFSARAPL